MYVYLVWKTTVINDKKKIIEKINTKNQCTNICLKNITFFLLFIN